MKKSVIFILLVCCCTAAVFAQQLTRFAVVDLPKVYSVFFLDSQAVRQFEERAARVQAEIDRMNRDILETRSRHADAVLQGDQSLALRLENEINRKSEFLREYYTVKMAELEAQRKALTQSGSFLEQVHGEIRRIAESEGYSMVINIKDNTGILWFSPTVDITDRLIQNLQQRSRR